MFPIDPILERSEGLSTISTTPASPWSAPRTIRIDGGGGHQLRTGPCRSERSERRRATSTCPAAAGEVEEAAASLEDSHPQVRLEGST